MIRIVKFVLTPMLIVALVSGTYSIGIAHSAGLTAGTTTSTTTTSTTTTSTSTTTTTTSTSTSTTTTSVPAGTFYLAIGGSSSLGTQPTGIAKHNSHRTSLGYANDLMTIEDSRDISLNLFQIGCPGETVQSMLNSVGGDHCYQPPVTQLSTAQGFLLSHNNQPGVVTIDLGFNDIRPCLSHATIVQSCFNKQLAIVKHDLPVVLHDLTDVAGPRVRFVGFEYEDPFLERYLAGPTGPAIAAKTLIDVGRFNVVLHKAYLAASMRIANLPATFKNDVSAPVMINNVGTMPENVAVVCNLTWMCQPPPFGPDDHPNNEGYMSIAEAIAADLPATW